MMNTETQSQTKTYIPELDGLRAVAILAVLLFHLNIFPFLQGGFTGVDIFFVISGYVISRSLYNKTDGPFHKYLGGFYKRRMLRIVPALFTCLLITHFVSVLFIPSAWRSDLIHDTGLSAFFGFSNFALVFRNDGYFSPHAEFNVFLHTWSLGVEEQFYLFFPIVFFLWLKFRKRKNALGFISRILLLLLAVECYT
jgi:peptidoglycan/LPS O-acetylase OafA/YrhL